MKTVETATDSLSLFRFSAWKKTANEERTSEILTQTFCLKPVRPSLSLYTPSVCFLCAASAAEFIMFAHTTSCFCFFLFLSRSCGERVQVIQGTQR